VVLDLDGVGRKSTFTLTSPANQSFAMPTHVASISKTPDLQSFGNIGRMGSKGPALTLSCRCPGVCEYSESRGTTPFLQADAVKTSRRRLEIRRPQTSPPCSILTLWVSLERSWTLNAYDVTAK